jgi:hypothetical protein
VDRHAAAATLERLHGELSKAFGEGAALAARLPPPWAALVVGVGVLFLLHGARRRTVLAVPGGAILGLVAARVVLGWLDGPATADWRLLLVAAVAVGVLCGGWPPLFPVLALALPGALIGAALGVAGRAWLGAAVGGAAGAALGALLREWVAAISAGGIGASGVLAGAIGLLANRPVVAEATERPLALAAAWGVLAVAGAAFHAGRAWPRGGRAAKGSGDPLEPPEPTGERTAWDSRGADR